MMGVRGVTREQMGVVSTGHIMKDPSSLCSIVLESQPGFLTAMGSWQPDFQKILRLCWAVSVCVFPTRVVFHPSLHHSVLWKADLYTLDQPGCLGSALAGDLRPGGEEDLGIYPLAPTLLVCISLPKSGTSSLSRFQDHFIPSISGLGQ